MAAIKGLTLLYVVTVSLLIPNGSIGKADHVDFGRDAKFRSRDDRHILGGNEDDDFFGMYEKFNSMHYVNDDPEASGDDDDNLLIPVPKKPVLPKSRPTPEAEDGSEQQVEPNTDTAVLGVSVEPTSFEPVEFNFEHKYPVLSGEQSTANPEDPESSAANTVESSELNRDLMTDGGEITTQTEPVSELENELDQNEKKAQPDETVHIKKEENIRLKSAVPNNDEKPDTDEQASPDDPPSDLLHNGHMINDTNAVFGETNKRSRSERLSNIGKIGIAMGCVVVCWLLLCPVVCIVCRRRDRKREKRNEEYKVKNGAPHHQHPLVEEVVLTELAVGKLADKHTSNGKEKLYENEAQSAEELEHLNQSAAPNNCNHSEFANKQFPGHAPLASTEALDTEV